MEVIVEQKYKETDIGRIPDDWKVVSLGDICIPSSSRFDPKTSLETYKCVELEHLSQGTAQLLGYADSSMLLSQKTFFAKGDVLFGKLRPYLRKFLYAEFNGVCTTEIWVLKVKAEVNSRFVFHLVQSDKVVEAANQSTGTKMPRAEWKTVSQTRVALPELYEQTAIATTLSDTDALITGLEKLIEKKRLIKQGAMQELFKPKKEWEVKRLGDIAPLQRGFDLPTRDIRAGKYPVVYSNGIVNYHAKYQVKGPGIVTGRSGTIGKVTFVADEYWPHNTALWVTDFKGNYPKFIYYLFLEIGLERFATGTGVPTLNRNDVHDFMVAIPIQEEQKRIADALSDMDSEIDALERKLVKYTEIKQGMMQVLLTGRVRLITVATANRVIELTPQPTKKATGHNVQFNEAVLISVLAGRYGNAKFPLGRFRYTKFLYLFHRHVEGAANGYLKKAAGPYNPSNRYGGPEGIAIKNKYVQQVENKGYVAADNIDEAKRYFSNWYHEDALIWLDQFRFYKNDQLELLTTVDMAVDDLRKEGKAIDVAGVKAVIAGNKEWKAKLKKPFFNDIGIAGAIRQSSELFP